MSTSVHPRFEAPSLDITVPDGCMDVGMERKKEEGKEKKEGGGEGKGKGKWKGKRLSLIHI